MAEGNYITLGTVLRDYSDKIKTNLRASITEKGLIASGGLLASVQAPVQIFGTKYILSIIFDNPQTMGENYWKYAEFGRRAGTPPPIEPILKWIAEKGIPIRPAPTLRRKGIGRKRKSASILSRARSVAFLIARSIGKRGTIKRFGYKGSKFYTDVIDQNFFSQLKSDITKALKKDFTMQIIEFVKR